MTEKRDIFDENNLVSTTEMTGAAPSALDPEAAQTLQEITNARCSPAFIAEDPAHTPLFGGNGRPSGKHNPPRTTPASHPAKGSAPFHRDASRNP